MIFSGGLCEKVLDGSKTVTRRPVKKDALGHTHRCTYEVGRCYAVQGMRGGAAVGYLRVLAVARETITFPITWTEAAYEGFDSPGGFEAKWHALYGDGGPRDVWRIEFELVTTGDGAQAVAPENASGAAGVEGTDTE